MSSVVPNTPQFVRRKVTLEFSSPLKPLPVDLTVLVINDSREMAKEITMQLSCEFPGCSFMYAPTLALSKLLLRRRKVDLIVSSEILADGNIAKLRESFNEAELPELLVVGSRSTRTAMEQVGFTCTAMQSLLNGALPHHSRIAALGADLRNDLNNPLQEIVAMVFVAKTGAVSDQTAQALEAINRAAKNMAQVVRGLEEKIKTAAEPALPKIVRW
jgi:hypothetical protein